MDLKDPATYLDANGKWSCIKCGRCCEFVHYLTDLSMLPKKYKDAVNNEVFPREYLDRNNKCIWLMHEKTCAIYDRRPKVCRIPKEFFKDEEIADDCATLHKMEPVR